MLYVEQGEAIWNTVEGEVGKSCASCHGDAAESMAEVGANYPKWDAEAKRPVNVELQINECREQNMKSRKRVVEGERVVVCVDRGGRRIIKTKKKTKRKK